MAQPAAHSGWPRWWLRRSLLTWVLWPLSALFAVLSGLRRALYRLGLLRSVKLNAPVVVVGNLTVGGSGKTPLIAALAQGLQRAGWHPGIISRGYGRTSTGEASLAVHQDSDPMMCGDEPVLLAQLTGCPVQVGRKRADAARDLLAAHPSVDVLLSDDGLQHLALARDVELVVIDQRMWGNGLLLPAGPLRESPGRRRDATLGASAVLQQIKAGGREFALTRSLGDISKLLGGERLTPAQFAQRFSGQPLGALAGIGHPGQFFAMLRAVGLQVQGVAVGDHHPLSDASFAMFPESCPVLITEKDAIKSAHLSPALRERLWVVGLRLELPGDLLPWLHHRLEIARGHPTS
ncbi:MAG: tetraacyldisaccharide 4'-kinase [Thiomonas sp. 20-64-5]|nr:MAG: tetraacyldisaccharide 4'-kinase [Thiomonas sp. 20-64-5]